jgi:three-Cys-motif partner protein
MKTDKFDPLIHVTQDDLFTPEVRSWSLDKYKLIGGYCNIFTTGMKDKWNQLVYIDLFAGAGFAKIIETNRTYRSSALIAMSIPYPFSKYILCEEDPERFEALKSRVNKYFAHLDVTLIQGDSNKITDQVIKAIPPFKKGNTLLSFCFVDPFSLGLHFKTIENLGGNRLMDFLILQALHMDANRNLANYLKEENDKINFYLGNPDWRNEYHQNCNEYNTNFVKFLADQYQNKMKHLGYIPEKQMMQIRSNDRNLPLYYLAFYSKHPRGIDFFKQIEQGISPKLNLDL